MANYIFTQDYVTLTDSMLSVRVTEISGYPKVNVTDMWDVERHFANGDGATDNWILDIDFGATQSLAGIFLNHINLSNVTIQKSADGSTYTNEVTDQSVSKDTRVNRYKVFIPFTAFNHRYLRIYVPSGAWKVDGASVWTMATVVPIVTYTTMTLNPSYGYTVHSSQAYREIKKQNGSVQRIQLSDKQVWSCDMPFDARSSSNESDFTDLNALDPSKPVILYENRGYDQHAYLCVRDQSVNIRIESSNAISGSVLRFKELV